MATETEKLEQKLKFLEEQQDVIASKIKAVKYALSIISKPDVVEGLPEDSGLTEGLLYVLNSEPTWFAATPLADRLKELGFDASSFSTPASFVSAVSVTLKRLANSKRIQTQKQDGKTLFGSQNLEDWI
jgi:hypothetical protein